MPTTPTPELAPITTSSVAAKIDRDAFYREWIAALRSGTYKQGKDQLKKGNRFCCLGVACDLAAKKGVGRWEGNVFFLAGESDGDFEQLPEELSRRINLDAYDKGMYTRPTVAMLADENDLEDTKFPEIADMIELHAVSIGVRV